MEVTLAFVEKSGAACGRAVRPTLPGYFRYTLPSHGSGIQSKSHIPIIEQSTTTTGNAPE
ncbi:hypothetical protein GC176_07395 [bacterium]|nr:hypothetical protein [bacterium]